MAKNDQIQLAIDNGIKVGMIRPITVNPFPYQCLTALNESTVKGVLAVEMSIPGQMINDVRFAIGNRIPIYFYGRSGGELVKESEVMDAVKKMSAS